MFLRHTQCTSQLGCQQQVLLMTCQVIAVRPDGTSYKARALLDSSLSASFISERVAQHLCLPHRPKVSGIGGETMHLSPQASVNFTVKPVHSGGKTQKIEVLVLRKITSNIPSCSVAFNHDWKHLSNLTLADPELEYQAALTFCSEQMCFHARCFMAGSLDPQDLHQL